jgi:LuxR family maltose regulon positive regulatory protein
MAVKRKGSAHLRYSKRSLPPYLIILEIHSGMASEFALARAFSCFNLFLAFSHNDLYSSAFEPYTNRILKLRIFAALTKYRSCRIVWYTEYRRKSTRDNGGMMDTFFLATKLRIPPQHPHSVRRSRLTNALESGIPEHKLILISAPAGYGKTTLLAQWAHSSHCPIAWVSISPEDNDIERFLRCLLATWDAVQPGVRESPLGLLLGAMAPNTEAVLSAFVNLANDVTDHLVFVLDDYHMIDDPFVHRALTFLLDHLPPTLHFVLVGRNEPPLPLGRYRARAQLLEFRMDDLQFQQEETADFLNRGMGLDLSADEVETLQTRLEGWIAGLQLMALSRQRRLSGADQLIVSGRHRFIADFLSEDVLAPLEADKRQFLLQTSILDSLCGSLCDAVIGNTGSQEMLEILERQNLFLVPLDDNRQWFRYHRLFADFLLEELKQQHPDMLGVLHHRAARWYLEYELPEQAFHHAVEGSDAELVVQIMDRYGNAKLNSGEIRLVGRWVDSLPAEWYSAYPVLGLARVGFLAYTGAFEASVHYLDQVEQRLVPAQSEDTRWQLSKVIAVRCYMACMHNDLSRAETYADRALQELPEDDLNWRPGVYGALGDTYRQHGRWEEAKSCYLKALPVTDSPVVRVMSAHVFGALADLALRQGRLREADGYWKKALAVIQEPENWGRVELPTIGWVYIRMGELLYEWNELVEAWEHLSQGLERAELGGDVRALIAGYLIAGRVKLTQGDIETAAEYLERARPLVEKAQLPDWISRFERFQIEVWLAQDNLRTAIDWVDQTLRDTQIEGRPDSEVARLAMAHVLIVKGDAPSLGRALTVLEELLLPAETEGRTGVIIEALALQALTNWKRGLQADAMTSLERALRLAEPEGYVRLFADLGLPIARLLQEARSRGVMPDYVATLLAAFRDDLALPTSPEHTLPEPLTNREQEILELVAAGLTNQEIAEKLVISSETVKKHTGTIYGKLGVSNRTEAAARARALDLLG